MKILIVSGFLGAGKTTFIKELVSHIPEKRFVILENDYGGTNLDSQTLSQASAMDIWELTEGCACCTMQQSFVSTLLNIDGSLSPEILIVEPTGIAMLNNLLQNIQKLDYSRFELLPPVVILAPQSYELCMREYPDIYQDQIRQAGSIIFSKTELENRECLTQAAEKVKKISAKAKIIERGYKNQPETWWKDLVEVRGNASVTIEAYKTTKITSRWRVKKGEVQSKNMLPKEVTLTPGRFASVG